MRNRKIVVKGFVFPFIILFSDRLWYKYKIDEPTEAVFVRMFRSGLETSVALSAHWRYVSQNARIRI